MEIKARIYALTEQEAKAALEWVLWDDAIGRSCLGIGSVENTKQNLLNLALKEVQEWQRTKR